MVSKKILLVGTPNSGKLTFMKELTGTLPNIPSESHSGIIHHIELDTKYYKTIVDIWVDEFQDDEIDVWVKAYLSEEASEIREVLGAIIIVFRETEKRPFHEHVLRQVKKVKQIVDILGSSWDGILLAIKVPEKNPLEASLKSQINNDALMDACLDEGFEYIDLTFQSTKQSKEGIHRVREALETFIWNEALFDLDKPFFDLNNEQDMIEKISEKDIEVFENLSSEIIAIREQAKQLPLSKQRSFVLKTLKELT
ncbi:hypothetical protein PCANB_002006 [Pneumocystis canis]|nr:hypothetical protein PCK1_001973 [Pneumocystis canis]KAG5439432.1 hypothetical protein PCANB_002006 [Pneumocystis canis]